MKSAASTATALALLLALGTTVARAMQAAPADPERAAITRVLERAGLLADPFANSGGAAAFGAQRVSQALHASEPRLAIAYGAADDAGRPREATVTVQRWVEGALEIRRTDEHGRDQLVSKALRDSCAQQVTLRRMPTADDPLSQRWHVTIVSAFVGLTPAGRTHLPLVDLNTRRVSGGFLSVGSDVEELAVYPQNCAVTAPGDSVRVFVGGLDEGAVVSVFADGRRVAAVRRDGSHAEATVSMKDPGLGRIGVTVYSARTLDDDAAPADTRTWVLPILVGAVPPPTQQYFAL